MSNLSISLTPELEKFINSEIESGEFESKGQLVRKALRKLEEDLIVQRILRARKEIKDGMGIEGDPIDLIKKI